MRAAGGWALAMLLAPALAPAAVTLDVEAVFPAVRARDPALLAVSVENDDVERSVVLEGWGRDVAHGPRSLLGLTLAPGARKQVELVVPPGALASGHVVVRAIEDGTTLAERLVAVQVRADEESLVACIGASPPALLAALRETNAPLPIEIEPARLSRNDLAWPRIDALVWTAPASDALPAHALAALRRWTLAGGTLVAGSTVEEPDALARMGLHALPLETWIPVVPTPAPSPLAAMEPYSVLARAGLGAGRAPRAGAAILLGAFFIAAAPLEAWLSRRPPPRGWRRVVAAWRVPLLAVAATLAAHALATSAARRMGGTARLDVVELHADGTPARGTALLAISRGRSATADVALPGLTTRVLDDWRRTVQEVAEWELLNRPPAHPGARIRLGGWDPAIVQARLPPGSTAPPGIQITPSALTVTGARMAWMARGSRGGTGVRSASDPGLPAELMLLAWTKRLAEPHLEPVLGIITAGAAPGAAVDGVPVADPGHTIWLIPVSHEAEALPLVVR